MKKLFGILICLFALFLSSSFAQKQTVKRKNPKVKTAQKVKKSLEKQNKNYVCNYIYVVALNLSQTEVSENCLETDKDCSNNRIIEVTTVAPDVENIRYVYIVSAGKIIGEGANVKWDLSDVKPGKYTITAGISQLSWKNQWETSGTTQTKVITIKE